MATLTPAATAAQKVWLIFFSAPEFRPFNLEANQAILENALTENALSLSVENLRLVFPECESTLARISPRVQPQAVPAVEPVAPVVELAPDQLPLDITRKHILDMPKAHFYKLQKQYGNTAIEARVNGIN
jgi:hypothetical protein